MGFFGNSEKSTCKKCQQEHKMKNIRFINGNKYCGDCSDDVVKQKEQERNQVNQNDIEHVIISTTSELPGHEIDEYLDPISTQVVMGVNAWKDLLGSWGSFWGGRTKTLERELSSGYSLAIDDLKREAFLQGADAVIGVEFDGGMEMGGEEGTNDKIMVVSGMGTAVRLKGFEDKRITQKTTCPECDQLLSNDQSFCTSCGTEVT